MGPKFSEEGDWKALIEVHPLESHDPKEWLRYGVALLQTIEPGPDMGRQQQQAALAFVQAQNEGATAEEVAAAQRESLLLSLRNALTVAEIAVPELRWDNVGRPAQAGAPEQAKATAEQSGLAIETMPSTTTAAEHQPAPLEPLRVLIAALARVFDLELPQQAAVLDQLLAAKGQLRSQQVGAAAVEAALCKELPAGEPAWTEALQKVLLVLR